MLCGATKMIKLKLNESTQIAIQNTHLKLSIKKKKKKKEKIKILTYRKIKEESNDANERSNI